MNTKKLKTNHLGLLIWLCALCSMPALAHRPASYDYKKQKEVVQSFKVGSNDLLQIDNRYGNITVTHWSKNEVEIRVKVEAKAGRETTAQEALDRVRIDLKKEGGIVSGITTLKSQNNWSGNNNVQSLTIDYYISMPSKLASDLSQKYGNINLPDQNDGKCSLHLKYGNLNAGNFSQPLVLEAKYGNVDMGHLSDARLDLGYIGNMTCKDAKELTVDSKYSKLEIGKVQMLALEEKYGNLSVVSIDRGRIELKYGDATIGLLKTELNVDDLGYGSLTVKEVAPSFTRINVESRYGNLHLNIPGKTAFTVKAEDMRYGKYNLEGFNVTSSEREGKTDYRSEVNGGGNRHIYFNGNSYGNLSIKAIK